MAKEAFAEALEGDDPRDQTPPEEPEKPAEEEVPASEDTRIAHEPEPEGEEEAPREDEPHRRTSKERRDARKRYQQQLRAENQHLANQVQSLMQRLGAIETGQGDSRLSILDSDIKRCSDEVATADRVYAQALDAAVKGTAGASEDVLQAQRFREQSQARLNQLQSERERLNQALAQARANPPQPPPVPGSAQADRQEAQFRADRPWLQFDAQSRPLNIESGVARTIGIAMRAQGFDPAQTAYWTEMDKRLRGALPHMFEADDEVDGDEEGEEEEEVPEQTPARSARPAARPVNRDRGPPVGRSGRNAGTNREVVLSRDVVEALKEAGWWDDPKERDDALRYMGLKK